MLRNATCSRGDTEKYDNTTKSARVWPLGKSHDFPSDDPLLNCLELPGATINNLSIIIIHDMV